MSGGKSVRNGIDNTDVLARVLKGKRLGLITGPTGVNVDLRSTASILHDNFHLKCLFAPEHGLRGVAQAGDRVENETDAETGLPVYSLYKGHSGHTISAELLENLDAVVFDMQDVGARFYTYLYTLTEAMEACGASGVEMVVLDRVNPVGLIKTEGTVLEAHLASFVGKYAIPIRYALTIGEFAQYINQVEHLQCSLTVVPCTHYSRETTFEETGLCWVMPSPNMPTPVTALVYIGTCLFEGTNLSEGRGTTKPFEIIGAPWLKAKTVIEKMKCLSLEGVRFGAAYFTPSFSKYQQEVCEGIQIHVTEANTFKPFDVALHLLQTIRLTHKAFTFLPPSWESGKPFIAHLLGSDHILREDFDVSTFIESQSERLEAFNEKSRAFRLY